MRYFPMFLDMAGRAVLIAGGGEQAAQKARLLIRTEARLSLMAPALIPELGALVGASKARHVAAALDQAAIREARYVFICTGDDALDLEVEAAARAAGALVNVVDRPERCDMITPALVDRDPVVVAIGTEGAAPVLARTIKSRVEAMLPPELGAFVEMARGHQAGARDLPAAARLDFWRWALTDAPWRCWLAGDEEGAARLIAEAILAGGAPESGAPTLTMVEAPAAPDLTALRAVERMQGAATILHAEGADTRLLDLARRDARRIPLSACPRHGAALEALREAAADGPVVALATPACRPMEIKGLGRPEWIGAAKA
ncbi:MAG: bifunctional precorrin-2 dehydrogenase/sirohydrochlorin ferrochelatase [Paracoccaceae bacterium]